MRRVLYGLLGLFGLGWLALAAYAYWPGEPEQPAAALARPGDRFVAVQGLQLRYRVYGTRAPGRPELLLIHGFANSLQSWRELAPRLAADAYLIAIDLPGFGLSSKPVEHDYRNGAQAEAMIAATRALGLSRPVYVGHSLGGAVALQAAVRDPRAGGLVLMNPGIITTGVPKIVQITLPPLPRLSAKMFGDRAFRERFVKSSYVRPQIVTPAVVDELMLAARSEGYRRGMTSLMTQYSEGEEIALAARVRVPVLIAWGDRDRNKALAEADELQALLPGSSLVRCGDAGHYVHEEAPQEVAAAIRAWLPRTALAPGARQPVSID